MLIRSLVLAAGFVQAAVAQYSVATNFTDGDFFSKFSFFTGADPTGGFVNFLDGTTARQNNLTYQNSKGQIYIGVDSSKQLDPTGPTGRDSVRIASTQTFTHYLTVINVAHMPGGICGTWPAFWTFGNGGGGWPAQGEIDIIEGANDQNVNYMTLHTSPNCTIQNNTASQLQPVSSDCNTLVNGNEGCSFHASNTASYGTQFNAQGGGVYATEWDSSGISIWFWPAGQAPADALSAAPDPAGWGTPNSRWAGAGCTWDPHFQEHNVVFDTTFCGKMGDGSFGSCAGANGGTTCEAFVASNPAAFAQAYWLVNSLVVYQQPSGTSTGSPPPASSIPGQPPEFPTPSPPVYSPSGLVTEPSASAGVPVAPQLSTAARRRELKRWGRKLASQSTTHLKDINV